MLEDEDEERVGFGDVDEKVSEGIGELGSRVGIGSVWMGGAWNFHVQIRCERLRCL